MLPKLKKLISLILSLLFIIQQSGLAQNIGGVDVSKYLGLKPPVSSLADTFRPVHLRYLSYDSLNNSFKLLLDQGSLKQEKTALSPLSNQPANQPTNQLNSITQELLKYFFIGLTLPNSSFWVNLRPDAPDNIIDDDLAKTDVGKILLEADLNLKKNTSNWTSPQTPEGKAYWDKLYQKAGELYGSENITIPTLTRPWIVPDEIILRESPDTSAYIYKATLKVMLEEDYLSRGGSRTAPTYQQYTFSDPRLKELNEYSTQLIKELIIPRLTREINSSRRYAQLRQVYYSLILAQHFKKKLTNKTGPYSNLIDSRDLTNLTSQEPWDERTYFKEYQKSFQEGEYKLKANQSTTYGQVIRRYMSGGVELGNSGSSSLIIPTKDNRIINHPEILKVSSAILPGDLKAFGRPTEALKSSSSLGNNREKGARNIVSSATYSDSGELIFRGFEGKSKAETLKEIIGSLQQKVKEIEEAGKGIERKNGKENFFEEYRTFKESIYKEYEDILDNPALAKRNNALIGKMEEFGELLDKFRVKVINIVKNDNEEKVFFLVAYVSIFYDLEDKLNKAMHYPYYIEYGAKVDSFIRVMDAYMKLLSDIQNPEKIKEGYAKGMVESRGEPELTYRLLKEYNKLPQGKKSSAIPEEIKESDLEEILKTFSLNNPDWLGGGLKNKITEDYGGLSVLEPIITDQYGQWNDVSRLSGETMNKLKARLNKEEVNEYFYLPIITKHWVNILTSQYWVNSYNYKVVIAKKSALEKSLNYTYREIIEGNDDILLLWEFTVRLGNKPPTIILEQQGLYKELRGQGFISEAYPLFVQCLAEKFPGWHVEGEFENPTALALFKNNFFDPRPLSLIKGEETNNTKPVIWKARIPPFNPSSSSIDNPGGIDLTALPITTQFVLNKPLAKNMPVTGSDLNFTINLDNELRQIQSMLNSGIMPSSERIREYALASSSLKPEDYSREIDKILGCIADIFRLEEEKAKPTPQALKDALILLESDKPA